MFKNQEEVQFEYERRLYSIYQDIVDLLSYMEDNDIPQECFKNDLLAAVDGVKGAN